jgi:hypothetical protein
MTKRESSWARVVIKRDGEVTAIKGWRAWVVGAIVVPIVFGAMAFLALGLTVSVAAFLILMPSIVIVALLGAFLT